MELTSFSKGEADNYSIELRLDSETGAILGQTNIANNAVLNQQNNNVLSLKPVTDKALHNLYILIIADKKNIRQRPLLKPVKFNPI